MGGRSELRALQALLSLSTGNQSTSSQGAPTPLQQTLSALHRYLATAVLGVLLLRRHLDFDGVACAEEPVLRACCCWEMAAMHERFNVK